MAQLLRRPRELRTAGAVLLGGESNLAEDDSTPEPQGPHPLELETSPAPYQAMVPKSPNPTPLSGAAFPTAITQGRSRMSKGSRTDLCGGWPERAVVYT